MASKKKNTRKSRTAPKPRRDWAAIVAKVQNSKAKKPRPARVECSTPTAAQVQRVRLLDTYDGIAVRTEGKTIVITKAA